VLSNAVAFRPFGATLYKNACSMKM